MADSNLEFLNLFALCKFKGNSVAVIVYGGVSIDYDIFSSSPCNQGSHYKTIQKRGGVSIKVNLKPPIINRQPQ
jgi:hypothetical protein